MLDTRLLEMLESGAEVLRPPRRMRVSEAAAQYLHLQRPGAESGPWNPLRTPYMVEPLDQLANRNAEAVIFVGPARTGKTFALLMGWLSYIVCCDPGDTLIVHMAENTARKFSKDELARSHRHSPELRARLSPYASDDNVFDKRYRNGMLFKLAWPSVNQLSGDTLRYVGITDYDRFPESIGGEGDGFTLARKRVQTFLSSGRVCVESSPGYLIEDPRWTPKDPHDPPPCKGIFSLYAQGDRRRWYWPCPECGEYFTAVPSIDAFIEIDGEIRLVCPSNGCTISAAHKSAMNRAGHWLAAGQTITRDGIKQGDPPKKTIPSYWLTGPAAAYQTWDSLWRKYRAAEIEFEKTGSEESLKSVTTGDFGTAYRLKALATVRDPSALAARAELWSKRLIPPGVCFITAAVDVQGNRFVVQVLGYGKGGERWLVDRYSLRWSPARKDPAGQPEAMDPLRYAEDWAILITDVARKPYPLEWDEGRGLLPVRVAVDSGGHGEKGGSMSVTEKSYAFWRHCRAQGLGQTVRLVKGGSRKEAPRWLETWPDSSHRRDRKANARGEIPVYSLNTTLLKDALAIDLERTEPGPGYIHFPSWLKQWFYDELTSEIRTATGWEKTGRNEAVDLMVYNIAIALTLNIETLNWELPPAWADPERSAIRLDAHDPQKATTQGGSWKQLLNLHSTKASHPAL